ncbi:MULTISPECIES: VanZ family protein [Roseateles]|uniref:VanZ family protein n=1 Tax=Roseateles albus TaxID=2987525 RepID=A0ABT5KKV6_9BURK|nr:MULTISPECIES: VanZ family protein [Roseateles]MCV2360124.1 VanZ family protein [Paucibacter sp. TC2R-5]MDC8774528.1 VanZ family protein [Roseateles albus]
MARRQSSATWLLLAYACLIVYASLYPFGPWVLPPGVPLESLWRLPWPKYFGAFDQQLNLIGYLPLGLLGLAAGLRSGLGLRGALLLGLLPAPLLSYVLETVQFFLPSRVPSLADWLLNSIGAWAGVVLGLVLHAFGGLRRWHELREYWFVPHSASALALLAIWPLGLLFPTSVPLGLGRWLPHLQDTAVDLLENTPWALQWSDEWVDAARALPPGLEAIVIALGLLAPALLVLSVAKPGKRRALLVLGLGVLGVLITALSTGLNFGPHNAWAWLTLATWPGLAIGLLLGLLAAFLPRQVCAGLGLLVLSALIALISQTPADPYLVQRLQTWEQGRFINLYGLAEWIGWVWPFAAALCLLNLMARRKL